MPKLAYDLHLHSCLSPCGDQDMTPANIVGMAVVNGLELIAVTDHNSCRNCKAVLHWAEHYGILAVPGMELTTEEEVHVLCIFPDLENALAFDAMVYSKLNLFSNKEAIFGPQLLCDEEDEIIGHEPNLLIQSTRISFDKVNELVEEYQGVMIPAHIDKNSHSLLYNLGFIPIDSTFPAVEIKDETKVEELKRQHPYLNQCRILHNSDAHFLKDIKDPRHYLEVESKTAAAVIEALKNGN